MIRSSDCFAIVYDCILIIVKSYKIAKVCGRYMHQHALALWRYTAVRLIG
jgi:hypothetical protein